MWYKYSSWLRQGWSPEILQIPKRHPPRLPRANTLSISKIQAASFSSSRKGFSLQQLAKNTLDAWKETVTSSQYYLSAKEYSSKLRISTADNAKRIPTNLSSSSKTSLATLTQPVQQALEKSLEAASSQMSHAATRIIKSGSDSVSKPAQRVIKTSSEQISKSVASATAAASTAARQVAESTKLFRFSCQK